MPKIPQTQSARIERSIRNSSGMAAIDPNSGQPGRLAKVMRSIPSSVRPSTTMRRSFMRTTRARRRPASRASSTAWSGSQPARKSSCSCSRSRRRRSSSRRSRMTGRTPSGPICNSISCACVGVTKGTKVPAVTRAARQHEETSLNISLLRKSRPTGPAKTCTHPRKNDSKQKWFRSRMRTRQFAEHKAAQNVRQESTRRNPCNPISRRKPPAYDGSCPST